MLQLFDELSRGQNRIKALRKLGYEVRQLRNGLEILATREVQKDTQRVSVKGG